MSRSLSRLRRGLLGIAFAGSMGLGVTQAFANSDKVNDAGTCPRTGEDYPSGLCGFRCANPYAYCSAEGYCICPPTP
jgi:hypothetical protein